jgi:hypothetical protein
MSTWENRNKAFTAHAPEFFFEEADQPLDQIREVVRVRRLPHLLAPGGRSAARVARDGERAVSPTNRKREHRSSGGAGTCVPGERERRGWGGFAYSE